MPDYDPLDRLHNAWQNVPAPPVVRTLKEEDALTQAAVHWMADAWTHLDTPALQRPQQISHARKPQLQLRKFAWPTAAAVCLSALLLWNTRHPASKEPASTGLLVTAPEQAPTPQLPAPATPTPVAGTPEIATSVSPQLLATNPEYVQMRSGTVRLTMLRGNEAPLN